MRALSNLNPAQTNLKVCGSGDHPNGLHEGVAHYHVDVGPGEPDIQNCYLKPAIKNCYLETYHLKKMLLKNDNLNNSYANNNNKI